MPSDDGALSTQSAILDMCDPYTTLGLPRNASQEQVLYLHQYVRHRCHQEISSTQIKLRWRELCMQHHPDLVAAHRRANAETYFKEIQQAYTSIAHRGSWNAQKMQQAYRQGNYSYQHARPVRFSNGLVGAVLFTPLVMLGWWLSHKRMNDVPEGMPIRPFGFLHPPVNPYLREDLLPRTRSRKTP